MESTKKKRGGARAGAGRPRGDSRMISFRAPGALADRLDRLDDRSGFIRQTLDAAVRRRDPHMDDIGEAVPAERVAPLTLPYFDIRVAAGFPVSLDTGGKAQEVDLLSALCPHPEATYLIRVKGDSMIDAGVESGDIVIVDKSNREPSPKEIAICELNGEYTLKRFVREGGEGWLIPANPAYPRFRITPEDDFSIWGTVTYIIHRTRD